MTEFQVDKNALSAALGALERVIPSRHSNPLLTAAHATLTAGTLTLTGSNLELDLQVTVPVTQPLTATDAAFLVPAHLFGQLVRNAPTRDLTITHRDKTLTLTSKGHDTSLTTTDPADYPPLTFPDAGDTRIDTGAFTRALRHVGYAVATEAFQQVFRGLRIELTAEYTRFVASDGYRLAFETVPGGHATTAHLILPGRSAETILALLKGAEGDAALTVQNGILTVRAPGVTINAKLMDGEYPDYTRIIPQSVTRTITVNAEHLQASVARVYLLTDEHANYRLHLHHNEGRLTLTASNDYGTGTDTLDAAGTGPDSDGPFELSFNARLLREAIAGRIGEISLHVTNAHTPVLITDSVHPENRAVLVTLRA